MRVSVILFCFYHQAERYVLTIKKNFKIHKIKFDLTVVSKEPQINKFDNIDYIVIGKHHELFDISGYYCGLKSMKNSDNLFLLINETAFEKYSFKLLIKAFFLKKNLLSSIKIPLMAGIIHRQTKLISTNESILNTPYISTFFFVLNKQSVQIFKNNIESAFNLNIKNDLAFLEFLNIHLNYDFNEFSWNKSDNPKIKSIKRKTVIFERLLSLKISKNGMLINLITDFRIKLIFKIIEKFKRIVFIQKLFIRQL